MTTNPTAPQDGGEKLAPCPFCGGEAERIDIESGENAGASCVSCTRCLASGNLEFGRKENFISNWSRRSPDLTTVRNEALEEAAKVADQHYDNGISAYGRGWDTACRAIAKEIRALQKKGPSNE